MLANLFLGFASELFLGKLAWEPVPGCPWKPVPGYLFLDTYPWKPCVVTLLGNLLLGPLLGHLFLGTVGNLCKPAPGNNLFLGTLLRNLAWEPALWNLASKPVLANFWEPWEPLPENLAWEPCLGTSSWESCLGTSSWEQWDFGCSDLLRELYYGWRPQAYAVGEKDSAPRSSIALLEWLLSTDVRGVWDTATSEVFICTRGLFWYMLACKHHCMPQSMSLFYLRVVFGYLQLLPWEESNKVIEQFSTSIWVWVHTRDVQLNYLTILWWSKTLWCLPQLWTLVSGVLEVPWVLKQFSHFTVSSPAVDKPEHNVTKLTNLTKLTNFFDQLDRLDPCLTNCWPSFDQVFTNMTWPTFHQLFTNLTNFSPTWPTFYQLDQIDLTTNNQLRSRLNWITPVAYAP